MLNRNLCSCPFIMTPEGSLNRLAVSGWSLAHDDPLSQRMDLTGSDLVSRRALLTLLQHTRHERAHSLRHFISEFSSDDETDQAVLTLFARRFAAVINTARSYDSWRTGSDNQQKLFNHWHKAATLVISGGLSTPPFGLAVASAVESILSNMDIICSPWGGQTALWGLAQTVKQPGDCLVMDFGATGIKRAIAHKHGNRLTLLPELKVEPYKVNGLIRRAELLNVLRETQVLIDHSLPVAISIACYLENGHPFDYRSGIYHRLGEECENLTETLNQEWLPEVGLGPLLLLEHDSTAAALAFRLNSKAMMITLGTGLGSAPCPID